MPSTALTFARLPNARSAYGEQMYARGRALVADHGVRIDELVWDADEVLWDWVVDARGMLRSSARMVLRGDLGHREHFRIKPGIFELLWGMHHASIERGLDPYMRVWTNGYPWRAWRVAREVPGWDALLGPPARSSASGHESFAWHPRFFCRADFARALRALIGPDDGAARLGALPPEAREVVVRQLRSCPFDSTLKVPELALLAGKDGFLASRVLVDDQEWNAERFAASGRVAVHVVKPPSPLSLGPMQNAVWTAPHRAFRPLATRIASAIASALVRAVRSRPGTVIDAWSGQPLDDYPFVEFSIEIPDTMVRREWVEPLRCLRRDARPWRR